MISIKNIKKWTSTRIGKVLASVLLLLVVARLALPYVILYLSNKNLASMNGYYGKIEDISVSLFRGAYTIDGIYIHKINEKNGRQDPFFRSSLIDLSIEWKSLLKGRLAGEIILEAPFLKFTENKVELGEVAKDTSDFRNLLQDFMPIQINRCEINEGTVMYVDSTHMPAIQLEATHIDALAQNLRNTYNKAQTLPATLKATARMHGGTAELNMRLNPLAKNTDFDMDLRVIDARLPQLNDFFKAYANVDVKEGMFSMYMESAAKDGNFVGYVKPFIRDLDVLDWKGQDKDDPFFHKIWEGIVGLGGKVLENRQEDEVATKIPLSGSFSEGIHPNIMVGIVKVIQNAFFKSLKPAFDFEINFDHFKSKNPSERKGLLRRIFNRT